jgi:shikimate dehydrogenase
MNLLLNKQTVLCISLASHPGNFGNYFHNYLYQYYGLNYLYKSCSTDNLKLSVKAIVALKIRGCGVSMPFKSDILEYVDHLDLPVKEIGAANTIVNNKNILTAYNTDCYSLSSILAHKKIPLASKVLIKGSGGMAKAVVYSMKKYGINHIAINARNETTRAELADKWGLQIMTDQQLNDKKFDIIINATPLGMENFHKVSPFNKDLIKRSNLVIDVVVNPNRTEISKICDHYSIPLVGGEIITKLQAKKQFELYTGQIAQDKAVDEAYKYYISLVGSQ